MTEEQTTDGDLYELFDLRKVPPGGWQYRDPDTNYLTIGNNFPDLKYKAGLHRKANNLEVAPNFELLIMTQICQRIGLNGDYCQLTVDYREGQPMRGLGDLVAKTLNLPVVRTIRKAVQVATYSTGGDPKKMPRRRGCSGCASRQKRLNQAVSFKR